ncbi:hypothetical protein WA171_001613 [Blastocystis sp. BT1]
MNDPLEFSPWQNNPLDWMTRELNKKNAKLKGYTPRYNKSVPFDRIFKYDTNVVTKNPASVNYMKPFSFDLTYTKMNTERPKLVDKYVNNSTNKRLRIADRMRKMVGDVKVNRAVDMSNIPSEEQDKVLKILGMTESQLKDTPPENYFGTRIGRTGAKEQVIYNFDLWMQYPVLNQDPSHLELNERYRINYAYGSPLVMGSIQARTIWIQKSVYKPINWNDVDKGNVENNQTIVPRPVLNPVVPGFIMPSVNDMNENSNTSSAQPTTDTSNSVENNPVESIYSVEDPDSTQIQPNQVAIQESTLTNLDVLHFCRWVYNKMVEIQNRTIQGHDEFSENTTIFINSRDSNKTRFIRKLITSLENEMSQTVVSDNYSRFSSGVREFNESSINNILEKMEDRRGDQLHKAFWKHCFNDIKGTTRVEYDKSDNLMDLHPHEPPPVQMMDLHPHPI